MFTRFDSVVRWLAPLRQLLTTRSIVGAAIRQLKCLTGLAAIFGGGMAEFADGDPVAKN
jgi:hypothetical protein